MRNVAATWTDAAPSSGLTTTQPMSTASSSPQSRSMGFSDSVFSLRRRSDRNRRNPGAESASLSAGGDNPPPYEEFGMLGRDNGSRNGDRKGDDVRSIGGASRQSASSAPFDMSELGSFARGSQEVSNCGFV